MAYRLCLSPGHFVIRLAGQEGSGAAPGCSRGRMRIHFYRSVTEAWGFAYHRFDMIARQAWFPVLIIILLTFASPYLVLSIVNGELVTIASLPFNKAVEAISKNQELLWSQHLIKMVLFNLLAYVLVTLLYASFFVPLLQYTARGIMPSHRSVNLAVGPRHFKFLLASFLTVGGILLILWSPMLLATHFIDQYVAEAVGRQYANFPDPNSLHTIEIVAATQNTAGFDVLKGVLWLAAAIAVVYFTVRFFPVPFFAGVREKADGYNSLKAGWQATRGWNTARLAAVLLVLWLAMMLITYILNIYIMPMTLQALRAMYMLVTESLGVMGMLGRDLNWILDLLNWIWVVIKVLVNMAMIFLTFGLVAGLAGSLFRQAGIGAN